MDSGTLSWITPLGIGLATGLVGAVIWIVRLAIALNSLKHDNARQDEIISDMKTEIKELKESNKKEHDLLTVGQNTIEKTLERVVALFEGMDKKQEKLDDTQTEMNRKIDTILTRLPQ